MITNPWINRCAALALLFMMYAVGISVGRDQAAEAHHNHPACHQGLKPLPQKNQTLKRQRLHSSLQQNSMATKSPSVLTKARSPLFVVH